VTGTQADEQDRGGRVRRLPDHHPIRCLPHPPRAIGRIRGLRARMGVRGCAGVWSGVMGIKVWWMRCLGRMRGRYGMLRSKKRGRSGEWTAGKRSAKQGTAGIITTADMRAAAWVG